MKNISLIKFDYTSSLSLKYLCKYFKDRLLDAALELQSENERIYLEIKHININLWKVKAAVGIA